MKPISQLSLVLSFLLVLTSALSTATAAIPTPVGQDKLRIHTSLPKRHHDSLFSYTTEWRIDDSEVYRVTGISFLNASKLDQNHPEMGVTRKLMIAIKDGLIQLDPNWRGVTVSATQDQPEIILANKAGYSFTTITTRDYSNQEIRYDLVDKSFKEAGVDIAFDIVYTADVEYLEGFTHKTNQSASQGEIIITIDQQAPLHIKTDGKTSKQLEEEIVTQLKSAHFSETAIFPTIASSDTRNIKPFDGGEIQLNQLAAKAISIDITDPQLGVLTKFKYPDDNKTLHVVEPRFMMGVFALVSLGTVLIIWLRNKRKAKAK